MKHLITLLALIALAGCGGNTIVVNVAPPVAPTATPPTCPSLTLASMTRTVAEGEVVHLQVAWPGPGEARVQIGDFTLIDSNGKTYVSGGDSEVQLRPGQREPAELTAEPLKDAWLVEARLDYPGCPPAVVALPEPK